MVSVTDDQDFIVEIVRSQYGDALYINNHRVAGVKPIGGGKIVREWKIKHSELLAALGIPTQKVSNNDA